MHKTKNLELLPGVHWYDTVPVINTLPSIRVSITSAVE